MIRVVVVASTPAMRLGMRALLESPDIEVAGEAVALGDLGRIPPSVDVIVTADHEGLGAAAGVVAEDGRRALVVLTDDARRVMTLRALPLVGWGIVPLEASAAEFRATVTAAAEGLVVLPLPVATRLLGRGAPAEALAGEPEEEPLTPREREVLELVGQGLANRAIAERLGISEHTAKFHVASVLGKLGASSRTEAVTLGLRRGLITL